MKLNKYIAVLVFGWSSLAVQSDTITWDGSENPDYSWATNDNWVGGATPNNGDFGDLAAFTDTYFGTKTVEVDSGRKVQGVVFDNSVGWSVTGSQLLVRTIESSGAGSNHIGNVKVYGGTDNSWTIGLGNILALDALYVDQTKDLSLSGGGTLDVASGIGGWSSDRSITINDATLKVASTFALATHGTVYMNDASGKMLLNDTVANITSKIGSSIIDNTALGLSVVDMGGGVSQVSVIPEPSTAVLVLLSGLGMVSVLRKRKS